MYKSSDVLSCLKIVIETAEQEQPLKSVLPIANQYLDT